MDVKYNRQEEEEEGGPHAGRTAPANTRQGTGI